MDKWGSPTGSIVGTYGPIVDHGYDVVPCPWCETRECLKASETGPLPDRRTVYYCTTNNAAAFRAFVKEWEVEEG